MIQSKFQDKVILGFWITLSIIIFLFIGETYYLYDHFMGVQSGGSHRKAIINMILSFSSLLFLSIWLKTIATVITINTDQNTITFTNFFTKNTRTYSFNDFDGYVQTTQFNSKTQTE